MSPPFTRDTAAAAVSALATWMRGRSDSRKPQLLLDDRDDFIILLLSLRRIPSSSRINPYLLPLPHPVFSSTPNETLSPSIFLITDDRSPSAPSPSSFLDKARELNLPISESIGISALRSDYRPYEARRKLCGSHDLFFADRRIIPLLPHLLGKTFFEKKKTPLPVDLSRPGWPEQIKRTLNSTFFYLRSGTCSGIRVGKLCMGIDEIVDNVMEVIEKAVEKVPKKWGNVRSLYVRAVDSVALPIYQALPEMGLKIDVGEKVDLGDGEVLDRDEDEEKGKDSGANKKKNKKNKIKNKGGMRYIDDNGDLIGEKLDELVEEVEEEEMMNEPELKKRKKVSDGNEKKVKSKKNKKEGEGEGNGEDVMEKKRKNAKKDGLEVMDAKEEKEKKKKRKKGVSNESEDTTKEHSGKEEKIKKKKNKKEISENIEKLDQGIDTNLLGNNKKKKKKEKK